MNTDLKTYLRHLGDRVAHCSTELDFIFTYIETEFVKQYLNNLWQKTRNPIKKHRYRVEMMRVSCWHNDINYFINKNNLNCKVDRVKTEIGFKATIPGKLTDDDYNELNNIDVKYFTNTEGKTVTKLTTIVNGDWVDLRAGDSFDLDKGEFFLIPLGVGMRLPNGYEAIVAPRSSTFKRYGIIQANSIGIIDNSYSGDDDQWMFPAFATRDTHIPFDARICQFRILENQPKLIFSTVNELETTNRGGFGSTGQM